MSTTIASWILGFAGLYLLIGLVFTVPFLLLRLTKSDPDAANSTIGFKLLILPGVIILWPALAMRWAKGINAPREERSPHRTAR